MMANTGSAVSPHARPLLHEQQNAAAPDAHKWVSASAGTGKTLVLVTRLIRLLVDGVSPDAIICLTFTKAGAAEMANRLRTTLARWVRMADHDLRQELMAMGISCTPDVVAKAPTLFVDMIDAAGTGLRIQTIHSFSQSLLEDFPMEADLRPGFDAMDEAQSKQVKHELLTDMLAQAESAGASTDAVLFAENVQAMAVRNGEDATLKFLFDQAGKTEMLNALPDDLGFFLYEKLNLPQGDVDIYRAAQCSDNDIIESLHRISVMADAMRGKDGKAISGPKIAAAINCWTSADVSDRVLGIGDLYNALLTKSGKPVALLEKLPVEIADDVQHIALWLHALSLLDDRLEFAGYLAKSLSAVRHYSRFWAQHKRKKGLVDYDDLIRNVRHLLMSAGIGDWIQYKMDSRVDHILVDEAQDTNETQWSIIKALSGEFFSGEGQKPGKLRTLFVVGDFKQAIFSFQGSSPFAFEHAKDYFVQRAIDVDAPFDSLDLGANFRTTPPILTAVDTLLTQMGAAEFGMKQDFTAHSPHRISDPGRVIVWPLVQMAEDNGADDDGALGASEEGADANDDVTPHYIEKAAHVLCDRIAAQIRDWIDHGLDGRTVVPGDILVLLRKRTDIAALLVAKLHDKDVDVEGIDRLLLKTPIAVQDLIATARFAVQPLDDLSLAAVLVSPLLGWSQDTLMGVAAGRSPGISLREAINQKADSDPEIAITKDKIDSILAMTDIVSPYRFFENILVGPIQGRRKLLARLGNEAHEPIDALLNRALAFSQEHGISLSAFIDDYDRDNSVLKRENSGIARAVRVMTVHGSKGLEAPIVILADAANNPDNSKADGFDWDFDDGLSVPLPHVGKSKRYGALADAYDAHKSRLLAENWRLMYVAMTRARDVLCIAGSLTKAHADYTNAIKAGETPPAALAAPPNSWYRRIATLADDAAWWPMEGAAAGWDRYGTTLAFGDHDLSLPASVLENARQHGGVNIAKNQSQSQVSGPDLPNWLRQPPSEEPRPPRPLTPSVIVRDEDASAPLRLVDPVATQAQRRGIAMHQLFEILPAILREQRRDAATHWLNKQHPDLTPVANSIISQVLAVIDAPEYALIFAEDALSEAPIAAVVNGIVISGQADRLLVTDDAVLVVDFKTGARVPKTADTAPPSHIRQMVAYVAALEVIFPGRRVDAALLYTSGPAMVRLDAAVIDRTKLDLFATNISLSPAG